ncbi:CsbD family protein [Pseudomonas huanghezhanensis]|uniref:CsbD family protein n=1 Tax=Pseudomonas huanghezhanensis TaxID=3002903 RepID=UPI0022869A81|nr:CsbD family protein [Pseudomonas sp. BSw22131]
MRSEHVKGATEQAAGKVQDVFGSLTGNDSLKMEGKARQAAGELQEHYGDVLDDVSSFAKRRPLASVAIAGGIAFLLARLLMRRKG